MSDNETANVEAEKRKVRQEESKHWLSYARDDYDVAHYLNEGNFHPKKWTNNLH